MTFLKIIVIVSLLFTAMLFFTLFRNGANLLDEPGMTKRLGVFLTINTAATSDEPHFEELRTPVFEVSAEELYQHVLNVGSAMGWGVLAHDSDTNDVNFVARSPVFLFEDDVYVQVKPVDEKRSSVNVQSSSRTGGADFAANSGHIQDLIGRLREHTQ